MNNLEFVEVFTTNVTSRTDAAMISSLLASLFENSQVTFDLQDVDRVLRIASSRPINNEWIVSIVNLFGFKAEVMPDVVSESVEVNR